MVVASETVLERRSTREVEASAMMNGGRKKDERKKGGRQSFAFLFPHIKAALLHRVEENHLPTLVISSLLLEPSTAMTRLAMLANTEISSSKASSFSLVRLGVTFKTFLAASRPMQCRAVGQESQPSQGQRSKSSPSPSLDCYSILHRSYHVDNQYYYTNRLCWSLC